MQTEKIRVAGWLNWCPLYCVPKSIARLVKTMTVLQWTFENQTSPVYKPARLLNVLDTIYKTFFVKYKHSINLFLFNGQDKSHLRYWSCIQMSLKTSLVFKWWRGVPTTSSADNQLARPQWMSKYWTFKYQNHSKTDGFSSSVQIAL
jgi:hypothetical protein